MTAGRSPIGTMPRLIFIIAAIIAAFAASTGYAGEHRYPEIHCRHFFYGYPAGTPGSNDLIIRDSYALSSNDATKLADWVAYRIDAGSPPEKAHVKRIWRPDPWLEDDETLEPGDYKGAYGTLGVDRGHMAPLGSATGKKNKEETNYLSNIAPQDSALNRGLWKLLEERERDLAVRGYAVYVMAGPLFESPMPPLPGADEEHRVPSGFWKIILVKRGAGYGGIRAAAFIFDQKNHSGTMLSRLCTIKEIERRSGLDFLWMLPKKMERIIEKSLFRTWARKHFRM